ncbi:MAG TPA: hypothetical protein VJJ83_05135 [Candidatus Babeliales bacterium]|nr:hypothetical protein [Candidatus Babeliales bacterium]
MVKLRPGFLLLESLIYLFLSSIMLTLLLQLTFNLYQQSRQGWQFQTMVNNLWAASELLKRDLGQLETPAQLTELPWHWDQAQHKLYRQVQVQKVCVAEQVASFNVRQLAPKLVAIKLGGQSAGRPYQLERLVYLPPRAKSRS